jgi:hypothetical protein
VTGAPGQPQVLSHSHAALALRLAHSAGGLSGGRWQALARAHSGTGRLAATPGALVVRYIR